MNRHCFDFVFFLPETMVVRWVGGGAVCFGGGHFGLPFELILNVICFGHSISLTEEGAAPDLQGVGLVKLGSL